MRRAAAALVALTLTLALGAAGCGLGAGEGDDGGATMTVTRDFGVRDVGSKSAGTIPGGETVMRMLERGFDVETRYGGGFVQSINGIAGGRENGHAVDWFYYVNGMLAEDGAAAHKLAAGDRVWWDHHDWTASSEIPAVIGAFPEPFLSGTDGKRLPVRVDCADAAAGACEEVLRRLDVAGIKAGRSAAAGFGGEAVLRIKVGTWADLRRDPAVRRLEEGPRVSGVYARPAADGRTFSLLAPSGERAREAGAGTGLIAATRLGGEAPTWIVTGTDAAGLAAAAAQLEEGALRDRFAVVVENGRPESLPIQPVPAAP